MFNLQPLKLGVKEGFCLGVNTGKALFVGYIPMEVQLFKCSWYPTKTALFCANTLAESVGLWPAVGGTTARDCHSVMPGGF